MVAYLFVLAKKVVNGQQSLGLPGKSLFRVGRIVLIGLCLGVAALNQAFAIDSLRYVSGTSVQGAFPLAVAGKPVPLLVSSLDFAGVQKVARHLQKDLTMVTQHEPLLATDKVPAAKEIVIIGTLGKSPIIDKLVKQKKLNVSGLAGKWDTFVIQQVEKPMKGVSRALVIAGSNKRGTIYGMYDLSAQIGVSPWYWWADVPVEHQKDLYVLPGRHTQGEPAVKYRGFFINDEAPALSGWSREQFGGFNHKFYDKVFELLMRMKGNYLWPAMWGSAFNDDDPQNPILADEWGVVMGTSHHEPLMRAHDEWRRYGSGPWNYTTNADKLQEFWRTSVQRTAGRENIVTIGMRGDGDEPMSEESNISLLEKIVADQRKIIAEVTGKDAAETPQIWALYKEVQDYYDKGMRVPDDVTLLLCDDNWGNIRKLPKPGEPRRKGGYGIYYHYDYVGGPRNYKWLNTNPIPRIWEQMHLAYQHGADRLWIVNVGDIKPMEFPLEFFMDYAWAPEKWPAERLAAYTTLWAEKQFGKEHAPAIANLLAKYAKYNSRRKPEMLEPATYSLLHYREAETVVKDYNALAEEAEKINKILPAQYKDAYFQLVLHPILACANLNELYVTVARNRMYAKQGRALTNEMAQKAKALFERDAELSRYYNKTMAGGKWNHMMDQTHIGYTYWQQPDKDVMPEVSEITVANAAEMGIGIEGSAVWWPNESKPAVLPSFYPYGAKEYYIELFNRGQAPYEYIVTSAVPWVKVSQPTGKIEKEQRLWVSVDWGQVPAGIHKVPLIISGPKGKKVQVVAEVHNPVSRASVKPQTFVEANGFVSMEALNYTRAVESNAVQWQLIPDLGRTHSAVTPVPVTAPAQTPGADSPHLQYQVHLLDSGLVNIQVFVSPTLNYYNAAHGLRYAISIDDAEPQVISINTDNTLRTWEQWVGNNINITVSAHKVAKAGEHVVKFWMVDPGVVLQKLVIDTGGLKPSYLGAPESYFQPVKANQ